MADFQPLLLENLNLSLPQVSIRRICVNRHLPETNWVRAHSHDFEQLIVYLNGAGAQRVGKERFVVASGTVMAIPRRVKHAFERDSPKARSPLCLVIDLEISAQRVSDALQPVARLNATQMAELRRALVALAREVDSGDPNPLRQGAAILELTGVVLEAAAALNTESPGEERRHLDRVLRMLREGHLADWTPLTLAKELGQQRDVLNRALKRECGLTVGQVLAGCRVEEAKRLLLQGDDEIQRVGSAIGIDDRNYFSRWFRHQTGLSPSAWRRQGALSGVADGSGKRLL